MTRRRGEVTAEEYLARRAADPVLRAQDEAAAARHAALVDELIRAQQPLVDDLNAAGANVASVWDLVNTRDTYPHLVPVLIDHLPRDYPPGVRDGIARALAVPTAHPWWPLLVDQYLVADQNRVQQGLAVAVAAAAQKEDLPLLKDLISDRNVGETRALLLDAVKRLGGEEGIAFIADHADDPELAHTAQQILKRAERARARRRSR